MNFNPLIKLLLFVPQDEERSFFSFIRRTNLFSVSKFTCSPTKESEKLKISHFGEIHVQFKLFTVSYWVSAINEHSLWIHISQLSHRTALWPFRTAPLQRPQSALQFVQYQAPSPDSILTSSLSPRFEHEAWINKTWYNEKILRVLIIADRKTLQVIVFAFCGPFVIRLLSPAVYLCVATLCMFNSYIQ